MRILILRTFMHQRVWESDRELCTFEATQWDELIKKWEPGYLNLSIEDVPLALGIYTSKYFVPFPTRYRAEPVDSGTLEEKNISVLQLTGSKGSKLLARESQGLLVVDYDYVEKLFKYPDEKLMIRVDESLLSAKQVELTETLGAIPTTEYPPLSFTLDWSIVKKVLDNELMNLNWLQNY